MLNRKPITPLYYTLTQTNTDMVKSVPIILDGNLTCYLMEHASDYDVSVIRFSIPNYSSPMFRFIDNGYWIRLAYGVNQVTQPVVYDPVGYSATNRDIYALDLFIRMLNTTLTSLCTAFVSAYGALPSAVVPYFWYDKEAMLIKLYTDSTYDIDAMSPVSISINNLLIGKLSGFSIGGPVAFTHGGMNDEIWRINIFDFNVNHQTISGTDYIVTTEQGIHSDSLIDMEGVIIQSNLPTNNEQLQQAKGLPILQDYALNDENIQLFRNRIVFNAVTPFRQVPMIGDGPLRSVICSVWSVSSDGNITPMLLAPKESAGIKLMFSLKSSNPWA